MTPPKEILPLPNICICGNTSCDIPFGYCHCGCGEKTTIARQKITKRGIIAGFPISYKRGHHFTQSRVDLNDAQPFKIDGVYCRLIPLTQGLFTIVWESDYHWLMQWRWHVFFDPITRRFYARRTNRTNGKKSLRTMHNEILGIQPGSTLRGDHIGIINTLDNRRSNLRIAIIEESMRNQGTQINNTSGCTGVHFEVKRNVYRAFISVNKKRVNLGTYKSFKVAKQVRLDAELKYYGDFSPNSSTAILCNL